MAKQQNNGQEQDVNQLRKVRRDKLAELQQNGKDPFKITKFDQTHHSLEVKSLYEAHEAELLKDHHTPDVEGMDEEQAKELFDVLRELDDIGAKKVFARCPNKDGVGLAVYNRLLRAAGFQVVKL